ncbi:MAG: serine hydrolase domain-containing protein [Terracidiphilus sp.]
MRTSHILASFAMVLAIVGSAAAASGQTVDTIDPAIKSRVDLIATQVLQQTGVPSASIAVVDHGKLVYTHAYGKARLQPPTPATPEMRYSIGSISKQFTAAAILLLQEQGKLSLDDAVGKYLTGLTRGNEVTIREILSHTSGYQDYWPEDYVMTPMFKPTTAQEILDKWARKPLDFEPGTQWQYSNTNYVIAGAIVEKVSGEKLMDFLEEHIFHPLGMHSVWNSDEASLTRTDATAYYRHALGPLRIAPKEGRGWMFAAGELAMTAHDLALWDASLLAESVLKPQSYNQMFTDVKLKNGKESHYGLGVQVEMRNGHRSIEHSGEVSGFVSDNVLMIDDGVAVAVLTNQDAVGAASTIAHLAAPVVAQYPLSAPEQQALNIYRGLQQGKLDRSLLAPNLSDYFTPEAITDFQSSLAPLGEPLTFRQVAEQLRGGMTFRAFRIVYPGRNLTLTTYTYPDGKLEQYLIAPGE